MRRFLLTLAFLLLLAAPAAAAGPLVGIADDRVLLAGGPPADAAVGAWRDAGVDVVRIFVVWGDASPAPDSVVAPADPGYDFSRIDAAVNRVRTAGMEPLLTLTGPGPLWATQDPDRGNRRYRPDPDAYAGFAAAAAAHFAGRVHRYILWNEPNQPAWLAPQSRCTSKGCVPIAPHLYRELVNAAVPAIRAVDPDAELLIGALAPRGASRAGASAPLRPLAFLRALGCVDRSYRAQRSGSCAGFEPVEADGFAYHPHGITNRPDQPFPSSDDANLASLPRLEATLDRLRRGGRVDAGTGIWLDEYGYQTNPPDRYLGVSPLTQDRWLQQGSYIAARDRRVKLLTQYVWTDEPASADSSYSGWQSGLLYADGRSKPALAHFASPFFADAHAGRVWGQVRPGAGHVIHLLRRLKGSHTWREIATLQTDARGYFAKRMRIARGTSYRFTAD